MADATIKLNGETRSIPANISLDSLLDHFSLGKQLVAIELNGAVVRRATWQQTLIADGDKIEVVHFVGGG